MANKLSPATIAVMVQQYTSREKNIPQLAEEHKVSKATISRALNGAGIKPVRNDGLFGGQTASTELASKIVQDFRDGYNAEQLAEMHELSKAEVDKIIVEANGFKTEIEPESEISVETELRPKPEIVTSVATKPNKTDKVTPIKGVIDPVVVKAMCEEYAKGFMTPYDLAAMYNVSPTSVKWYLQKNGFDDVYTVKPDLAPGVKAGALRAQCREMTPEMLEIYIEIARDPHETAADRIKAADRIVERGYGKIRDSKEDEDDKEAPKTQGGKIMGLVDDETKKRIFKK